MILLKVRLLHTNTKAKVTILNLPCMKMHSPYLKLLHIEFIAFTNLCLKRHIALGARYLRKENHFFTQLATQLCCV